MLKAIVGLAILSLLSLIANAIHLTIFSYFTGSIVANDSKVLPTFLKSIPHVAKNFVKILGSSIILLLTIIFVNGLIAVFTFFSGLFFTIPATCVLLAIFKVVTYLNINGNRYYLSNSLIYNPQKYVVKKDEYVSSFIPPEETKEITTTKMKRNFKTKTLKQKTTKKSKSKTKKKG
jgi:hypothetical protein